jgi:hypothetical protein
VLIAATSNSEIGSQQYQDPYGLVRNCIQPPSTRVLRVNTATGEVHEEQDFRNIEINDFLQNDAGHIIGAATIFRDCVGGSAAAIVEIQDSKIELKYTHPEENSHGYSLERLVSGNLVFVGTSERAFAARWTEPELDLLDAVNADVQHRISDTFVAEFAPESWEPHTRWLQAGASQRLSASAVFGDSLLLVGHSGEQPYWIFAD